MEREKALIFAQKVADGVRRRKRMSIKDIKDRAVSLGYTMSDVEMALPLMKGVRVYENEVLDITEDFFCNCPFLSDEEVECQRTGWKSQECQRLLMTTAEIKKADKAVD
jgi:hypothetical protein